MINPIDRPLTGDRPATFLAEFLHAALKPSFAAAVGAIGVAGVLLLTACLLVTEQRVGHMNPGYLMVNPKDEYARLTVDTLRVAHLPPEPLSVVIVGDSSLREAITSEEGLKQQILQKTGKEAAIHLLAAGGLTHWETAAIVDRLSKRTRGVIVAEISPYQLSRPTARLSNLPRLGFDSLAFDRELRIAKYRPAPNAHSYFLNEAWFFMLRPDAIHNLIHGPLRDAPGDHVRESAQWSTQLWQRRHKQVYGWIRPYAAAHARNLNVYHRMAQRAKAMPDLHLALVNAVVNPDVASQKYVPPKGFVAVQNQYFKDVQRLAAKNEIPFWDVASDAQLSPDDFFDYTHIRKQRARERFTEALATRIAELLTSSQKPEQSS